MNPKRVYGSYALILILAVQGKPQTLNPKPGSFRPQGVAPELIPPPEMKAPAEQNAVALGAQINLYALNPKSEACRV